MSTELDKGDIDKLKNLIQEDDANCEKECGEILEKYAMILLPSGIEYSFSKSEFSSQVGRSDLIVVAHKKNQIGIHESYVFVWELKAPQEFLFELPGQSRAIPSSSFFEGENQVLHYSSNYQNNKEFCRRFGLNGSYYVVCGGLIIGRTDRFCKLESSLKAKISQDEANGMADHALKLRYDYLYKSNNIDILTWDNILERLNKVVKGKEVYSLFGQSDKPLESLEKTSVSGFVRFDEDE